jgi:hypothetical protein
MNSIIENWDKLTEEQKLIATETLKSVPTEFIPPNPSIEFFKQNKWVKINNFINQETAAILYHHVQMNAKRLVFYEELYGEDIEEKHGTFKDFQAVGDFSRYGDPIFDVLLELSIPKLKELTGLDLYPNHSYHRLYTSGAILKRHVDNPACEISVTVCLGYNVSNIDSNVYPDYNWPIYVKDHTNKEIPIRLNPGDMLIYHGEDLEHWREAFLGLNQAQLFMHYNELGGKYDDSIRYDSRPMLGLPPSFRANNIKKID